MLAVCPSGPPPAREESPTTSTSTSAGRGSAAALAALVASAAAACAWVFGALSLSLGNTLEANGRWESTKAALALGAPGSAAYMITRPALRLGRLNLAAHHGYQEVLIGEPLDPARIAFDYRIEDGAYLVLVFNKTEAGFAGARISRDASFPDVVFTATPEGEFLSKRPLDVPSGAKGAGRFELRFEGEDCAVSLDGREAGRCGFGSAGPQRVGFRGSRVPSSVDNVEVRGAGGGLLFAEDFQRRRGRLRAYGGALGAMALVDLAALALALRSPALGGARRLFAPLAANLAALAAGLAGLALDTAVFSDRYAEPRDYGRYKNTIETPERVFARIDARYPGPAPEGVYRIALLGGSQTWGAGASRAEDAAPARLERSLNARGGSVRYEALNLGVSAASAPGLLEMYEERWRRLEPDLMILNVAQNDRRTEPFAGALEGFLRDNREDGIKTVLVLEPRVLDRDDDRLARNHGAMRRLAREYGVPVVEMHAYLSDPSVRDRGFLWWDPGHLSSFGQSVFAGRLEKALEPLLP